MAANVRTGKGSVGSQTRDPGLRVGARCGWTNPVDAALGPAHFDPALASRPWYAGTLEEALRARRRMTKGTQVASWLYFSLTPLVGLSNVVVGLRMNGADIRFLLNRLASVN